MSTPGDVHSTAKLYAMARKLTPLLCELHAHTTWSDGTLEISEVVDLYGRRGFDVLCITDHVVRARDPWTGDPVPPGTMVEAENFAAYLEAIDAEAARAAALYDLLVLPGVELTYDDTDPNRAAHAVAVGLRSFVGLESGLEQALADARASGAALIAAHPYSPRHSAMPCAEPPRGRCARSSPAPSIVSRSSTVRSSSRGSAPPGSPPSPPATSTSRSTW